MIVVLTDEAEADLEEIGDWIARDDPKRAASFVAEIRARCESLGDTPYAFPLVPQHESRQIRRRAFRDYLLFYRVEPDAIVILHIMHGARDFGPIVFPD
jgi:toxin ParE1/3/4